MTTTTVTGDFIIEGAVRSMQAAQAALRDAVNAYNSKSYAVAAIMGAVAAEHLLRCTWLANLGGRVGEGTIECEAFIRAFGRHVDVRHEDRLRQSLISFTIKTPAGMELIPGDEEQPK